MSLFGGSSSSSSTTNLTQVDNTALGANAQDQAQSIILRGDYSKVEVLDAGAITGALGFAERNASAYNDATREIVAGYGRTTENLASQAIGTSENLASQAIGTSEWLSGKVIDTVEGANQLVTRNIADLARSNASDLRSFAEYQSQSESGRLAQLIQWGIVAAVAIFALQTFRKRAHA